MDEELKQELFDSFTDIYEEVEVCLEEIKNSPEQGSGPEQKKHPDPDPELYNRLFRSIHNAKGNASMMMLDEIVAFTHAIEEIAGALRSERFPCTQAVSEIIQISMDRLRDLHLRVLYHKPFDNLRENETISLLENLAHCRVNTLDEASAKALNFLGGGITTAGVETRQLGNSKEVTITIDDDKLQTDLLFFQELALQVDGLSHYWEGRSIQLFEWAMKVNRIGGDLVPYDQFAAAIYMHDIGMSYIPREIIEKQDSFNPEEWKMIQRHPQWGHDLLKRIPGWEEAATMVLDHQEHVNGMGYPNKKKSDEIHIGAKIISILDAFFSITNGRADRNRRKTIIRAISEINSGVDSQFDGTWVQCFNALIRQELKSGYI